MSYLYRKSAGPLENPLFKQLKEAVKDCAAIYDTGCEYCPFDLKDGNCLKTKIRTILREKQKKKKKRGKK